MLRRRSVLTLGFASLAAGSLGACRAQLDSCPVTWVPSISTPVFYGYQDFTACANPIECIDTNTPGSTPTTPPPAFPPNALDMRVYYPSLDGSPSNAAILSGCLRFPLVIFIHGDCGGVPYNQWIQLPAQLARSGYIVAVTQFGGTLATGDPTVTAPLRMMHHWLRNHWQFKDFLMPSPNTAVIGHSYGGTLAAQLSTEIPVMAIGSLSGTYGQAPNAAALLQGIAVPGLYLWNDNDDPGFNAQLMSPGGSSLWPLIRSPKHGVIFKGGEHADYMQANTADRCHQSGPCSMARSLAADFLTVFLSKYVQPQAANVSSLMPDNLILNPQSLPAKSTQQQFYAGGFLFGLSNAKASSSPGGAVACSETIVWETPTSNGQTFLVPL